MSSASSSPVSREEEFSLLFAQMVMQQSNIAMMLMGKAAHPESGKVAQDLEAARLFIDQLEMLEAKTKGNLSKDEESLLKQTLMTLRLTYVDSVETSPSVEKQPEPESPATPPSEPSVTPGTTIAAEEENRKKFTKK